MLEAWAVVCEEIKLEIMATRTRGKNLSLTQGNSFSLGSPGRSLDLNMVFFINSLLWN